MPSTQFNQREDYSILSDVSRSGEEIVLHPSVISSLTAIGFYVVYSPNCVGGAVVIETCHGPGYRGIWHVLETVEWTSANRTHYRRIDGPQLAVRVRIAEALITGTVSVYAVGH